MKVAVFSSKPYDESFLSAAAQPPIDFVFLPVPLSPTTAPLAASCQAVSIFVNDAADRATLAALSALGVSIVALRCAGFNNVDLSAAEELGISVCRVPAYSPHSVADHGMALVLALNRKIHRAHGRVRNDNFSLDGLLGFDLNGRTVGLIGTGKIGALFARRILAFGTTVIAYDKYPSDDVRRMGVEYVELEDIWARSDIISLHCPLLSSTAYIINESSIAKMKRGVMLINVSRGGLINTQAAIAGLKTGQIGNLAMDVYEHEGPLFFEDKSGSIVADDLFQRLLTFPNVLITAHQAFFTEEALTAISQTTVANLLTLGAGEECKNMVKAKPG